MNLALDSLYAWSVFVAPLEAESGWTRTQTSWFFTIAIVTFAISFVVARRIQDQRGPRRGDDPLLPAGGGRVLVLWRAALGVRRDVDRPTFLTRYLGLNYGLLFTVYDVAGLLGPIIADRVFDAFGDYRYAFFSTAGVALVALLSIALTRPPRREAMSAT